MGQVDRIAEWNARADALVEAQLWHMSGRRPSEAQIERAKKKVARALAELEHWTRIRPAQ